MRSREAAALAEAPEAIRRRLEALPFPDSLPAFGEVLVGDDQIWARHERDGADEVFLWSVYRTSGEALGLVEPGPFALFSVSAGRAFGIERDELGIERVQVREVALGVP